MVTNKEREPKAMAKQSRRQKLPYCDGTWFAVPLFQGGYAIGRIVRHTGQGTLLAYCFAPKHDLIPSLEDVDHLTARDSFKTMLLSDLHIVEGKWPLIGESSTWRREEWPMPRFILRDDIVNAAFIVTYADDHLLQELPRERVPYDTLGYDSSCQYGAAAAENDLSKALE